MQFLYVIYLSLFSIIVLFLITKLIGYRQMSEMSMFDYITGITIGSIAAEMATALDKSYLEPLTAMIIYGLSTVFLAWLTGKNQGIRHFINGCPYVLLNDDTLYEKNFKKAHIDLSEFLVQCRINGYFDLSQVQTAILEENGKISFLPKTAYHPMTPEDLSMTLPEETLLPTYIMDGKIQMDNLIHSGKNQNWLHKQLEAKGSPDLKDIFLAVGDFNDSLTLYLKNNKKGCDVIKE